MIKMEMPPLNVSNVSNIAVDIKELMNKLNSIRGGSSLNHIYLRDYVKHVVEHLDDTACDRAYYYKGMSGKDIPLHLFGIILGQWYGAITLQKSAEDTDEEDKTRDTALYFIFMSPTIHDYFRQYCINATVDYVAKGNSLMTKVTYGLFEHPCHPVDFKWIEEVVLEHIKLIEDMCKSILTGEGYTILGGFERMSYVARKYVDTLQLIHHQKGMPELPKTTIGEIYSEIDKLTDFSRRIGLGVK